MELRQVNWLIAGDQGSRFGRAAARLHLAQPTPSEQTAHLVDVRDVRLPTRSIRSAVVSSPEETLLPLVQRMLLAIETAVRAIKPGRKLVRRVTLGLPGGGQELFMSQVLSSKPPSLAGATLIVGESRFLGVAAVPALIPPYTVSVNPAAAITTVVGLLGAALVLIGTRTPVSRPEETVKELACPKSEQTLPPRSPSTSLTG